MTKSDYNISNTFVANVCDVVNFGKVSNGFNENIELIRPVIVKQVDKPLKSDPKVTITYYKDIFNQENYTSYFQHRFSQNNVIIRDIFPIKSFCNDEEIKKGTINKGRLLEIYRFLLIQHQEACENNKAR